MNVTCSNKVFIFEVSIGPQNQSACEMLTKCRDFIFEHWNICILQYTLVSSHCCLSMCVLTVFIQLSSIPGLDDVSNVNIQSSISMSETSNVAITTNVNNTDSAPVNTVCIFLFICLLVCVWCLLLFLQ